MIANKINDLKKDTDVGMEEKNIVVGLKKREESLVEVGKVIISHQIEYIKGKDGVHYTYDINTNTNYNSIAESKSDLKGMDSIATFLYNELRK